MNITVTQGSSGRKKSKTNHTATKLFAYRNVTQSAAHPLDSTSGVHPSRAQNLGQYVTLREWKELQNTSQYLTETNALLSLQRIQAELESYQIKGLMAQMQQYRVQFSYITDELLVIRMLLFIEALLVLNAKAIHKQRISDNLKKAIETPALVNVSFKSSEVPTLKDMASQCLAHIRKGLSSKEEFLFEVSLAKRVRIHCILPLFHLGNLLS
ncbi:hypothetical protein BDV96DRAFT_561595 [Lophiotrema nucula]|uniref:Uncharacterized protein n=1 Tax=Lophiotrema nucula TaxID=690887 RepID=A0A6A5ZTA8_9PLEO|nr:hypothetical protein BDV96DRAFT_561595 [Lophiotrema nucula]